MGGNLKIFEVRDRKGLHCPEEIVGGNIDIKSASYKVSEGNEEHVIVTTCELHVFSMHSTLTQASFV